MLAVSWDGDGSSVADTNVAVCTVLLGGNGALLHEFKKGEKGDNNFYFFFVAFGKFFEGERQSALHALRELVHHLFNCHKRLHSRFG